MAQQDRAKYFHQSVLSQISESIMILSSEVVIIAYQFHASDLDTLAFNETPPDD